MSMFIILHVVFSTVIALALGWLNSTLTPGISNVSLILGSVFAYIFSRNISFTKEKNNTKLDTLFLVVVLGLVVYHAAFLFYYKEQGWWTLNPHNYGDLPWHVTIIRYIAGGSQIWPWNPIYSNDLIRYPFAIDLYNALWESLGFAMSQHLFVTLVAVLSVSAFWIYRWLGWIGLAGIFFSGGWFGWSYLSGTPVDIWLKGVEWKNFILALWVPQRSLLIGLPLGLMMIKNALTENSQQEEKIFKGFKGTVLQIFLWGVFPFFHAHAFITTVIIVMALAVVKKRIWEQFVPLFFAAPLGTLFVYLLTEGFSRSSVARFSAGWMLSGQNSLNFWMWNLGPWMLVWLGLLGLTLTEKFKKYWSVTFVSFIIFMAFNFIILAPWEWDNLKILIWPYFLFVIILSQFVKEQLRGPSVIRQGAEIALAFVLSFSGVVVNLHLHSRNSSKLFEAKEVFELQTCLKGLPRESIFAAQPNFNHPLGALGHKLVLGYQGHLWSHGINYQDAENKLNAIMKGQDTWREDLKSLKVTHIFWGPREQETFGEGQRPWMSEFEKISCQSWETREVSVYVVK